mmetsp:Transcript_41096/g.86179  ORF Transcript_41096/g.86179 Transcript_41096/m.86179 type:complete len:319 (-) Transcript_41096:354-1310(-)
MNVSPRKNEMPMESPEERKPVHYALGDLGKPEDIADHTYDYYHNDTAIHHNLKPNNHCFVRRSGGRFTYAQVLSISHRPDPQLELIVDSIGSIKVVPLSKCVKYVRLLRKDSMIQPRCLAREARRRSSENLSRLNSTSSTREACVDAISENRVLARVARRRSSENRSSSKSPTCDSRQVRADAIFEAGVGTSAQRSSMCSRFRVPRKSSIVTIAPPGEDSSDTSQSNSDTEDDLFGNALSLAKEVKFDMELISKPNTNGENDCCSSTSSEGPLPNSDCQALVSKLFSKDTNDSVQEFTSLQFKDELLLTALHTIISTP